MKKNLLFVANNLTCGGAEKALVSLLETIDYSKYNVDLFLFKHEGVFLAKVPKEVTMLPEPKGYRCFDMPIKKSLQLTLKKGDFKTATMRLILGYLSKIEKNGAIVEQRAWKYISRTLQGLEKDYDVAIGFQEKNPIYYCVDKVKAKKKIGWVHTDFKKLGIDLEKEKKYIKKLSHLVTVSKKLSVALKDIYPEYSKNVTYIHNIISSEMIRKMSLEEIDGIDDGGKNLSLISVGRLAKEKGLDISLEAFDLLVKKGYDIKWYLIGEGDMRKYLEQEIKKRSLEERIFLLGFKENPYPYIKNADIYLQSSRYEGKSISIDEAKVLAKPIVITNFDTAKDHLVNNYNGLISEMNAMSVADSIEMLIKMERLRNEFIINLNKENFGTEFEIQKLYNLIDDKNHLPEEANLLEII